MSNLQRQRCAIVALVWLIGGSVAGAQLEGGTFTAVNPDPQPRFFHAGSVLNDGLVMISGGLGLQPLPPSLFSRDEIAFYDPADGSFTNLFQPTGGGGPATPTLLTARSSHTQTTLLDGRVLITGGHRDASGTSPGNAISGVELFDPQTGAVTAGPTMNTARAMHTATQLPDGRVVVAGGAAGWQVFTPGTDAWSPAYPLAHTRRGHAAVLLADYAAAPGDDRVLLIGGAGTGSTTLEVLDPDTGASAALTSSLSVGVDDLSAVRLGDGRVFIVGGQNTASGDTVGLTYLLDAENDVLTTGPNVPGLPDGIADHQLIGLGRYVLLAGGESQVSGADTILNYAVLFDSLTDTWFMPGAMQFPHDDFVALPIGSDRVLVVGGGVPVFGQEAPSSNVELFERTIACADVDGDGNVGLSDLAILLAQFGLIGPDLAADLDGDEDVDLSDLAILLVEFGSSC